MATNDSKLVRKVLSKFIGERTEMPLDYIEEDLIKKQGGAFNISFDELREALKEMESEARAYETQKIINVIWAWWNTKPQKRKNDATIRIITRGDITELVNTLIAGVDD